MKKRNLLLAGVIFTAFAVTTTSCKKDDDDKKATPASNGKATIKGKVEIDSDLTEDGEGLEVVPAGTVIMARIDSRDLVTSPSDDHYSDIVYSTEVDGNGFYTLTVDANANEVFVTIMPQDIAIDKITEEDTDNDGDEETVKRRTVFTSGEQNVTVVKGSTKIVDLFYND